MFEEFGTLGKEWIGIPVHTVGRAGPKTEPRLTHSAWEAGVVEQTPGWGFSLSDPESNRADKN